MEETGWEGQRERSRAGWEEVAGGVNSSQEKGEGEHQSEIHGVGSEY